MRKRLIILTAVFLGIVFTTNAQNRSHEKRKNKDKVSRLDSVAIKYGLNETQKANFKAAIVDKRKAQKALKEKAKSSEDKKGLKGERKQIMQTFDSSIKVILTSDQYTQFKADVEQKKIIQMKQRLDQRSERMADSMKSKYRVSAEQHGKVKAAAQAFGTTKMQIREKYGKSESKDEAKKEMKEARKTFDEALKAALTTAQYNQWKSDRKEKGKARKKK